jgi:hypothetical protein
MASSTKAAFTDNYDVIPGLYSTTDLSAAQFKVVMLNVTTPGQIKLAGTSVIARSAFVLMNDPKGTSTAPVNAEVAYKGIVKAIAGTSVIKAGDKLGVNTTSYVVNTTTANRFIVGVALMNSATIGDIISVALIPGGALY